MKRHEYFLFPRKLHFFKMGLMKKAEQFLLGLRGFMAYSRHYLFFKTNDQIHINEWHKQPKGGKKYKLQLRKKTGNKEGL